MSNHCCIPEINIILSTVIKFKNFFKKMIILKEDGLQPLKISIDQAKLGNYCILQFTSWKKAELST